MFVLESLCHFFVCFLLPSLFNLCLRHSKKTKGDKNLIGKDEITADFVRSENVQENCHVFRVNTQHSMKYKTTWITVLNLGLSVSVVQFSNTHSTETHLPQERNICSTLTCIYIVLLDITNWTKWMKGICHIWSRGRYFSPSLSGDWCLKLGSKSDHWA